MAMTLAGIHRAVGYVVFLVLVVALVLAWRDRRGGAAPSLGRVSATMVLVDLHVTVGLVLYVVGQYWTGEALLAYLHPLLAVAALGTGHAGLARARRAQGPAEAGSALTRGLLLTTVLVVLAIGAASA